MAVERRQHRHRQSRVRRTPGCAVEVVAMSTSDELARERFAVADLVAQPPETGKAVEVRVNGH